MTDPMGNDRNKADALIARVQADTEAELARIRQAATDEAAGVVAAAHGRARRKVHGEIEALRRARTDAARFEEARLDTARRQLRHREATSVIAAGLPDVAEALATLWADKGARLAWALALIHAAGRRLNTEDWVIEHPKGWAAGEQKLIADDAAKLGGGTLRFRVDEALGAGLRVRAGNAVLDASPAALMADEDAIGAALQAELAWMDEEAAT